MLYFFFCFFFYRLWQFFLSFAHSLSPFPALFSSISFRYQLSLSPPFSLSLSFLHFLSFSLYLGSTPTSNSTTLGLSLLPPLPVAGTGLDGSLEALIHRRIMDTDLRGDDNTTIDHTFALVLDEASTTEPLRSRSALFLAQPLAIHWLIVPTAAWWQQHAHTSARPLPADFPPGVHLLGLRWRGEREREKGK